MAILQHMFEMFGIIANYCIHIKTYVFNVKHYVCQYKTSNRQKYTHALKKMYRRIVIACVIILSQFECIFRYILWSVVVAFMQMPHEYIDRKINMK